MMERLALIGFGEAAQAFAPGLSAMLAAYDRKTDDPATSEAKLADCERIGVICCADAAEALTGAAAALSLVTADQALVVAEGAPVPPGLVWFDMNSVAPDTKRAAAERVRARGGRYVDVAVMAPVHSKRTATPLLVAGPESDDGAALLRAVGFTDVTRVDGPVGTASAIKMIRSVMVKGIEALSAECMLAAEAAGVRDAVIASLDASWPGADWAVRFDYNLDRMIVHGTRRAAEMDEVVKMLDALGTGSAMSRGTAARQRAIGDRGITVPQGLDAKLRTICA